MNNHQPKVVVRAPPYAVGAYSKALTEERSKNLGKTVEGDMFRSVASTQESCGFPVHLDSHTIENVLVRQDL
jgi:hypothetical protein